MTEQAATDLAQGREEQGRKEATLNKACEYCRGLKVRCFPEPGSSSSTCQRCVRSQRVCVFAPPQSRKQRKRTDARVAELEKEMKTLRSLLKLSPVSGDQAVEGRRVPEQAERSSKPSDSIPLDHYNPSRDIDRNVNHSPNPSVPMAGLSHIHARGDLDVIDRGLVSMALASTLYSTYTTDLIPHYPAVTFPDKYTAEELRRERPVLFLAVLSAASGKTDPALYKLLNGELLELIASRTMTSGEKTLEFVQAMVLTAVWSRPAAGYDQLKFYQYIHMAATIALDIGLGSSPYTSTGHCIPEGHALAPEYAKTLNKNGVLLQSTESGFDIASIDAKRTILVCYLICSGVAISMRRQNMLRFNGWMRECLIYLDTYPMATTFDKRLVARVKLQKIAEEFSSALSLDDPDDTTLVLDSRTQLTVKAFEWRLKEWRMCLSPEITNGSMLMIYYQTNILLHEIAIRDDHPSAAFKPPYVVHFSPPMLRRRDSSSSIGIESVMKCVTFSHDLLDTFLSLDLDTLRSFPVYKYVMVCYAILILTKLTQSINDPKIEIGKVLDHSTLALDYYSTKAIAQVSKAAGSEGFIVPEKFLGILMYFQAATQHRVSGSGNEKADNETLHLQTVSTSPRNPPSSSYAGGKSPASIITEPRGQSSEITDSTGRTGSTHGIPSMHNNSETLTQNISRTFEPPGYLVEHIPSFPGPQSIGALNIDYELDMDASPFLGLPQDGMFPGDLDSWMASSSVTAHTIDEQMLDLPHWGYSSHTQD